MDSVITGATEGRNRAWMRPVLSKYLALIGVLAFSVGVISEPLVSTARDLYGYLGNTPDNIYKTELERANLREANSRLLSELIALRSKRTQGLGRESALADKLNELEALIEGVTELGVFPNKDRKRRATKGSQPSLRFNRSGTGELAAILNSPQLTGNKEGSEDGVGGPEELCEERCSLAGGAGHVVVGADLIPSRSIRGDSEVQDANSKQHGIFERINRFISVLRVLPVGAPVRGVLSSGFGHRRSPFSRRVSFHYGVDLSLKTGSPVMATGAGKVIKVERDRTYGIMVDIQHTPGLVTRYAHLSRVYVRVGDRVTRGAVVALSGNTGRSTGPHLHYEVRQNGAPRNPAPFVKLAGRLAEFADLGGKELV